MKIALAQINSTVGDFEGNYAKIRKALADAKSADLVIFPEAALCGYPQQDLIEYPLFAERAELFAEKLLKEESGRSFIFGSVEKNREPGRPCRNVALFASNGKWIAKYFKRLLPTYDVFDEDRFFEAGRSACIVEFGGEKIAITICEDIWNESAGSQLQNRYLQYPLKDLKGATLLVNLSASPFETEKVRPKRQMLAAISRNHSIPLVYTNCVGANDGVIFDGRSYVWNEKGEILAQGKSFEEDLIFVDIKNRVALDSNLGSDRPLIEDLYDALILGIRDYCKKQNFTSAVLGLSGGIDSAVVACLAIDALGTDNVQSVLLPSRYTSAASNEDAIAICKATQNPVHLLPIEYAFQAFSQTLSKTFEGLEANVTEENLQTRIRGTILMALSNKFGQLLLTTGNKSELAVGYCTLYGDMCGGLAPLSDVYKGQVYALGREANRRWMRIPERIFEKAPTAELKPNQTDQDTLPPYDRLDAILKAAIEEFKSPEELIEKGHDREEVLKIYRWLGATEYKRFQMPLGLKVSSKAFGIGRRVPIVQKLL